eukprot:14760545-Alexandrium_andersonii.AAC.1
MRRDVADLRAALARNMLAPTPTPGPLPDDSGQIRQRATMTHQGTCIAVQAAVREEELQQDWSLASELWSPDACSSAHPEASHVAEMETRGSRA